MKYFVDLFIDCIDVERGIMISKTWFKRVYHNIDVRIYHSINKFYKIVESKWRNNEEIYILSKNFWNLISEFQY